MSEMRIAGEIIQLQQQPLKVKPAAKRGRPAKSAKSDQPDGQASPQS